MALTLASKVDMFMEIPGDLCVEAESLRPKMRRIPAVLRSSSDSVDYDPKMVSLGPFHHGKSEFHLGETFKRQALQMFLSDSGKDRRLFYNKIVNEIDEIRDCYDDDGVRVDDASLAEMMLVDGCFVVFYMEAVVSCEKLVRALYLVGMMGFSFAHRDMLLLENQIPFRVINLLLTLRFGRRKGKDLLRRFLEHSASCANENEQQVDEEEEEHEEEPLHLLDAVRNYLVSEIGLERSSPGFTPKCTYTSRSVTQLKAKGIHFRPSATFCLKDVEFESLGIFSCLRLPVRFVSTKTKVLFVNLIALEIGPNSVTDFTISSYVGLMKSLIHSERDVKELREKRILISNIGSDRDVFRVFDGIETYGMENAGIFSQVKEEIERHYHSKAKIWMAELIHTYFMSPWNAIALFAAIFIIILTYLQTYFTIHSFP